MVANLRSVPRPGICPRSRAMGDDGVPLPVPGASRMNIPVGLWSNAPTVVLKASSDPSIGPQGHPVCFSAVWTIAQCLSVDPGLAAVGSGNGRSRSSASTWRAGPR